MLAARDGERVGEDAEGIVAALRLAGGTADIVVRSQDLGVGQTYAAGGTGIDAQSRRIDGEARIEADRDAVKTEPGLIDHAGREDVRLVQGQNLPLGVPVVTEAGQVVTLQRGLNAGVFLKGIEPVQGVRRAEDLLHIRCALVDLHRSRDGGGIRVERASCTRDGIRQGDVLQQGLADGIRDSRTLGGGEHGVVDDDALVLTQALVAGEKEGVIAVDGTAQRAAEVGTMKLGLGLAGRIEVVAGVNRIIAQVLKSFTVELVGA